jgi:hypothetical protein
MLAKPTLTTASPPGMTLGELVESLANTDPRAAVLTERIRGWVKMRLIVPLPGERGSGKHHRYGRAAVYEIVMLNALANFNLPIASLSWVESALSQLREVLPSWVEKNQRSKRPSPLYLRIWQRQMHAAAEITDTEIKIDPLDHGTIIINLARIFSQVY